MDGRYDDGAAPDGGTPDGVVLEELEQLRTALRRRPVIELAKGALIALHRCGEAEAFDRLRVASQHDNVKVYDLAVALLHRLGDARPDDHPLDERALAVVDRVWGELLAR